MLYQLSYVRVPSTLARFGPYFRSPAPACKHFCKHSAEHPLVGGAERQL